MKTKKEFLSTTNHPDLARAVLEQLGEDCKEKITEGKETASTEEALESINRLINIHCCHGHYNLNPYMHGLANGLILAKSCITNEEPEYLEAPKTWLCDLKQEHMKEGKE